MSIPYELEYDKNYYNRTYGPILENKYDLEYLNYSGTIAFSAPSSKRILEVGCGLGTLSWGLSVYAAFVVGLDLSRYAVSKATEFYRSENLNFIIASGEFLPFKAQCIDGIVCSHLLEHLTKQQSENVLREMRLVLINNGYLVLDQPYELEPLTLLSRIAIKIYKTMFRPHDQKDFDKTHKRRYTIESAINEIGKYFSVERFYLYQKLTILNPLYFFGALLGVKDPDTWYIKLYLRTPYFLRTVLFPTPSPKIMAFKLTRDRGSKGSAT